MKDIEDIVYELKNIDDLYVYGLGTTGRLFVDVIKDNNRKTVKAIVVGNAYNNVYEYKGYPVITFDEYLRKAPKGKIVYTVKNSSLYDEIKEKCDTIDLSSAEFYRKLLEFWYNAFFEVNSGRISFENGLIIFDGMKVIDPRSIAEQEWGCFLQEIGDIVLPVLFDDYSRIDEGSYFLNEVSLKDGDVVVDAGANLGVFSSVAAYLQKEIKCYAFEPMSVNYKYLMRQATHYQGSIIPVQKALSSSSGKAYISLGGSQSTLYCDEANLEKEEISCITLDEFAENENTRIDFIKADIEGAECDMLRGAKDVLKKHSPKLAICTYHRPTDKEELTDIIMSTNPNYRIEYKWKKLFAYV